MLCFFKYTTAMAVWWADVYQQFTSSAQGPGGMKQPVGKGGPAGWILGLGDRCGQDTTSADTCHIVYFATFATHVVGGGIGWT